MEVSAIVNQNVAKEISVRRGVVLYGPSAGFMGSLARQITHIIDPRLCVYINICAAWFDIKSQKEVVNTKTFAKINEAIGIVGLHGLDTLYGYMIKNQLQHVQSLLKSNQDKLTVCNTTLSMEMKDIEQIIMKSHKIYQQLAEILLLVGMLQLLRRHIAYQLNTSCKFDSAHLESSLNTLNIAFLNEIKKCSNALPLSLIQNLEEYLVRCGVCNPFEKVYEKNNYDLTNIGQLMALVLVSQLPKLQLCATTGDLITKKAGENIDGYPFIIGMYTLMRQTRTDNLEVFINLLCKFAKKTSLNKLKLAESTNEAVLVIRILQIFCETFNYSFSKLEDKLPLNLLTLTK